MASLRSWWMAWPLVAATVAEAGEWSGSFALQSRLFPSPPALEAQHEDSLSLSFDPEFYHEWEERGERFLFAPHFRIDQHDHERSSFDVRELFWQKSAETWELRLGWCKVYWGVTESQHLVDIINQTDLVENPDGEEKLGQLMLNYALVKDWGTIDFFVMPGFRERTFPGRHGRLRPPIGLDLDDARYESGSEEWHTDLAVRYSHYVGNWDFGVSHFWGTSREPRLMPALDDFRLRLVPYYDTIHQSGVDVQYTTGGWLLKFEGIYRSGQGEDFFATTAGFEYTFYSVFESAADVGLLMEHLYDSRGKDGQTPFQNDIFLGTRLSLNDVQSTMLLAGVIVDPESGATAVGVEAERRLGAQWKLSVEARFFSGAKDPDPLVYFLKDDFVQIELGYYF